MAVIRMNHALHIQYALSDRRVERNSRRAPPRRFLRAV